MEQIDFGKRNPKAPQALSHFAFLIGRFKCQAKLKSSDENWRMFNATWNGRFILDGYAIADEYSMTGSAGELIVLGMNFRTYDAAKQVWNIKWLNALSGAWTDLGSEEFGGVKITDSSISYSFKEPVAAQAYTRATYKDISRNTSLGWAKSPTTGSPGPTSWSLKAIALESKQLETYPARCVALALRTGTGLSAQKPPFDQYALYCAQAGG